MTGEHADPISHDYPAPTDERPWAGHLREHSALNAQIREMVAAVDERLRQSIVAAREIADAEFRTHLTLINASSEKVALALASADKAVSKAELATEKRFEGVNEFREQLRDQASMLMPRQEAEQRLAALTDRFEGALASAQRERDGLAERLILVERAWTSTAAQGQGQSATWAKIGATIAAIAAVVAILGTAVVILTR